MNHGAVLKKPFASWSLGEPGSRTLRAVAREPITIIPSRLLTGPAARSPRTPKERRKPSLAEAIRYALARWPALTRFLEDGELDNNPVERAIQPIALDEKNICSHRLGRWRRPTGNGLRNHRHRQPEMG